MGRSAVFLILYFNVVHCYLRTFKEYILQFKEYTSSKEQYQIFHQAIHPLPFHASFQYQFFHRNLGYKSDFTVLQVDYPLIQDHCNRDLYALKTALRQYPRIRSITPQQQFSVELASIELSKGASIDIIEYYNVSQIWNQGITGKGIKVAIFDTGLNKYHPQFQTIRERINWTKEKTLQDMHGHGTFTAGIIAGTNEKCRGLAPDSELFIFRVYTEDQTSYTSWFLDAFNYALFLQVHVINLSVGGPDYNDQPFVDKITEMTSNNIVVVSAVGNGPDFGSLTNPADQLDVIGVGGSALNAVAPFSSRGMTMWELPTGGYGRAKPDLVAQSMNIRGSSISSGCTTMSGTSVASPIVAGAVALIMSSISHAPRRREIFNPIAIKHILMQSATRLVTDKNPVNHLYAQGSGELNLVNAIDTARMLIGKFDKVRRSNKIPFPAYFSPSLFPKQLNTSDCPYMWPFCSQPIFPGALPLKVNVTILNPGPLVSRITQTPQWHPGEHGDYLSVDVAFSSVLWPRVGYAAVLIQVKEEVNIDTFAGLCEGYLSFEVESASYETVSIKFPIHVHVIPTPPRSQRLLWDHFRNIQYPSAYVPRDSLRDHSDFLDSHGDHLHTNFHELWDTLTSNGYYIDILSRDYSCVDLHFYSTILLIDPEDEFFDKEIPLIHSAIDHHDVSLIIFADWHSPALMQQLRFFDTNTIREWEPIIGGSNVPALNTLLSKYNIAFGEQVWSQEELNLLGLNHSFSYSSGTYITKFPQNGYLVSAQLQEETISWLKYPETLRHEATIPILGLYQIPLLKGGRIVVFGDSSCIDASILGFSTQHSCFELLMELLLFTTKQQIPRLLTNDMLLKELYFQEQLPLHLASMTDSFSMYSKVRYKGSQFHRCV